MERVLSLIAAWRSGERTSVEGTEIRAPVLGASSNRTSRRIQAPAEALPTETNPAASFHRRALAAGSTSATLFVEQDSGTTKPFAQVAPGGVAVYGRRYDTVVAFPRDGGALVALPTGNGGYVAAEEGGFVESESGAILRRLDLGTPLILSDSDTGSGEIVSTQGGALLYWLLHGPPDTLVAFVATDAGTVRRPMGLDASTLGLVADDSAVYWAQQGGSIGVYDSNSASGQPRVLASRPQEPIIQASGFTGPTPGAIALDATHVYWLARPPDGADFATDTLFRANRCTGE
jgi:hypothetical protein